MTAAEHLGDAVPALDLRRARIAVAEAAEVLASVCRDQRACPDVIVAAERRLSQAYGDFGDAMLTAAVLRRSTR